MNGSQRTGHQFLIEILNVCTKSSGGGGGGTSGNGGGDTWSLFLSLCKETRPICSVPMMLCYLIHGSWKPKTPITQRIDGLKNPNQCPDWVVCIIYTNSTTLELYKCPPCQWVHLYLPNYSLAKPWTGFLIGFFKNWLETPNAGKWRKRICIYITPWYLGTVCGNLAQSTLIMSLIAEYIDICPRFEGVSEVHNGSVLFFLLWGVRSGRNPGASGGCIVGYAER